MILYLFLLLSIRLLDRTLYVCVLPGGGIVLWCRVKCVLVIYGDW
jgi:hypothetical protein